MACSFIQLLKYRDLASFLRLTAKSSHFLQRDWSPQTVIVFFFLEWVIITNAAQCGLYSYKLKKRYLHYFNVLCSFIYLKKKQATLNINLGDKTAKIASKQWLNFAVHLKDVNDLLFHGLVRTSDGIAVSHSHSIRISINRSHYQGDILNRSIINLPVLEGHWTLTNTRFRHTQKRKSCSSNKRLSCSVILS